MESPYVEYGLDVQNFNSHKSKKRTKGVSNSQKNLKKVKKKKQMKLPINEIYNNNLRVETTIDH